MTIIEWNGFKAQKNNLPVSRPGCYLIINQINRKVYVGISKDVARRLREHSDSRRRKLGNAVRKYGLENFLIQPIVYSVDDSTDWLPAFEALIIKDFDAVKNGYNIQENSGAVGPYGPEFSQIIRNYNNRSDVKKKFLQLMEGLWADPAFRKKVLTPKLSKQRSERFKTLNADPEFRAKVQEILSDPDLIVRRNKSIREKLRSDDYRKAQSDRLKEINTRPEFKARKRIAMQEVNSRVEVREKHRQNTSQLIWITDESINKRIHSGAVIPDGFRLGRVCPNGTNRPGKRWVTNGTSNLMIPRAAELPEGFRNGKIQQGAS